MKVRHIEVTDDGSHTVRHDALGVTFHSTHGAIRESLHVFIRNGLEYVLTEQTARIAVFEVGFGTGLNAILTYLNAVKHPAVQFSYTGIEKYPLDSDLAEKLNYPQQLGIPALSDILETMHSLTSFQTANFHFERITGDILQQTEPLGQYQVVYFDAFAPQVQPEIWSLDVLGYIRSMMTDGAVLVTYSAQGQFKRNLKTLGFDVESIPGPPGKREMVRARKTP